MVPWGQKERQAKNMLNIPHAPKQKEEIDLSTVGKDTANCKMEKLNTALFVAGRFAFGCLECLTSTAEPFNLPKIWLENDEKTMLSTSV